MDPFLNVTGTLTYPEYLQLTERQSAAEPDMDTDPEGAQLLHYTRLNLQRMHRWGKTYQPEEEVVACLSKSGQRWWVISEPWCGDSAQSLPIIAKLADAAGIPLGIVLRDEHPEIMDQYLTNGSRSIPVLIAFADGEEVFRWGPRPKGLQERVLAWKEEPGDKSYDALKEEVHLWYARDKAAAITEELRRLVCG